MTLTGAISRQHLTDNLTQILMLAADTLACLASFTLAHLVRFEGFPPGGITQAYWSILPLTVLTRIPIIFYMGGYQTLIRYLGLQDLKRIFQAVFLGSLLLVFVSYFSGALFLGYGRGVFVVDWLCLTVMLLSYRVMLKTLHQHIMKEKAGVEPERVALIWGSGEQGVWCSRYLSQSRDPRYYVVGFIDDEASLQHKQIDGYRVLGDHHHLEVLARLYRIQELFVAVPNISPGRLDRVQELCQHLNISLLRFVPRTVQEITLPEPVGPKKRGNHPFPWGDQSNRPEYTDKTQTFTRGTMLNRVLGKQTASPTHTTEQSYATKAESLRISHSILAAAILLGLAFSSGCGGGSTPLYYTAKSSGFRRNRNPNASGTAAGTGAAVSANASAGATPVTAANDGSAPTSTTTANGSSGASMCCL